MEKFLQFWQKQIQITPPTDYVPGYPSKRGKFHVIPYMRRVAILAIPNKSMIWFRYDLKQNISLVSYIISEKFTEIWKFENFDIILHINLPIILHSIEDIMSQITSTFD